MSVPSYEKPSGLAALACKALDKNRAGTIFLFGKNLLLKTSRLKTAKTKYHILGAHFRARLRKKRLFVKMLKMKQKTPTKINIIVTERSAISRLINRRQHAH